MSYTEENTISIEFTKEALEGFIEFLNSKKLVGYNKRVITFSLDELPNIYGKGMLVETYK